MSSNDLFDTLLRPAVLHILRAQGFHSAKGSVVDTLTDITARYLFLLATRTTENAYSNHNTSEPDVTDVRMALQDCGALVPTLTGAEETWKEIMRKPLEDIPERNGLRAKERMRRDAEDTQDVTAFVDWFRSDANKEIMRIAGLAVQQSLPLTETAELDAVEMEDYLTTLMKKHSKTGVESRFQGTVLGHSAEPKPIKIEGASTESIQDWIQKTREKSAKDAKEASAVTKEKQSPISEVIQTNGESEDVEMTA